MTTLIRGKLCSRGQLIQVTCKNVIEYPHEGSYQFLITPNDAAQADVMRLVRVIHCSCHKGVSEPVQMQLALLLRKGDGCSSILYGYVIALQEQ